MRIVLFILCNTAKIEFRYFGIFDKYPGKFCKNLFLKGFLSCSPTRLILANLEKMFFRRGAAPGVPGGETRKR